MNVYVAGMTHDYGVVRAVQRLVSVQGHSITHDWTQTVEKIGPDHEKSSVDRSSARLFASSDLVGVKSADLIIAVANPNWCGTLIEIGAAMAKNIPVVIFGQPYQRCVFWAIPRVWCVTSQVKLSELLSLLRNIEEKNQSPTPYRVLIEHVINENPELVQPAIVEGRNV